MKITRILNIAAVSIFLGFALQAQGNTPASSSNSDNTDVNTRDRNADERTADQAKENQSDREIMRQIRRAIVADDSLSTYAHNVKIISENGKVTLKGPVRSDNEKRSIEDKAVQVAGADNVINELSIKEDTRGNNRSDRDE